MANVKISALPAATTPLTGTEEVPLVQSATTKRVTVDNINANATLQQVTAGTNKDLTNDRNLQGTDAGNGNTGDRVNAFGNGSLKNNTGNDVNAFGSDNGIGNSFSSVNFLGNGTVADADQQTVFGNFDGTNTLNARLSYKNISDDRKYELPDASGTLVLSVNGNAPDAQGDVTVGGGGSGPQTTTVSVSSAQLLNIGTTPVTIVPAQGANKIIVPMQVIYSFTYGTTTYSGSSLVLQMGNPTISFPGFAAYLGTSSVINSQTANITASTNPSNLTNRELFLSSSSNPTIGDGTIKVTVIYNVITV